MLFRRWFTWQVPSVATRNRSLGISHGSWPVFVRAFLARPTMSTSYSALVSLARCFSGTWNLKTDTLHNEGCQRLFRPHHGGSIDSLNDLVAQYSGYLGWSSEQGPHDTTLGIPRLGSMRVWYKRWFWRSLRAPSHWKSSIPLPPTSKRHTINSRPWGLNQGMDLFHCYKHCSKNNLVRRASLFWLLPTLLVTLHYFLL